MKYCMIFHANLNYAYLTPKQYEFVIRNSYELIVDTMREKYPHQKYVFEASGFTIDTMALLCPDVLAKFRDAIARGQCEFMGSPYGHLMMSNFPEDMSVWALEFSQEAYQRHLGSRLTSGWNPECGWRSYVPDAFKKAGFKQITLDFESYSLSTMEHVRAIEYNPNKGACYGLDLPWYDLPGDEKSLHFPFKDVTPGLNGFTRTDRICQPALRWLMNLYDFEQYTAPIRKYTGVGEGALIVFAEDAEYVGTTGWFFLKYPPHDPERVFELLPDAREKLEKFMNWMQDDMKAEFETFDYLCNKIPPLPQKFSAEDGLAWHRAWSIAWTLTPEAQLFDPQLREVREKLLDFQKKAKTEDDKQLVRKAWFHLTCAANSDGRWPPPPEKVHPFNRGWVEGHLRNAKQTLELLGRL